MPDAAERPVRLAIVNDYEIVVAGIGVMLADRPEVDVVDLDDEALRSGSVDVVLYDSFGQPWGTNTHLEQLIARSRARVVVFTWTFDESVIDRAYAGGASGFLSKGLGAGEVVDCVQRVHRGERVTARGRDEPEERTSGTWPGQDLGLSARESEILAFITQGLSNEEIAAAAYLSVNSVKTYIRTAYRKIGVQTRARAVRYGMQHGFDPTPTSAVG